MRRLIRHAARGQWPADEAIASVTLDYDARHRRRIRLELDDGGGEALLDLERAVALVADDGLQLESGEWVAVRAAAEPVLEVTTPDPLLRLRLAWHLGNRHVPTELDEKGLRIRPDHVLRDLLVRLGARVDEAVAPFQPERGAYHEPGHANPHAHTSTHAHPHAHAHPPAPAHDRRPEHEH